MRKREKLHLAHGDRRLAKGSWLNLTSQGSNRNSDAAIEVREEFCRYFNHEGRVPWQDMMLRDY